jgi:hypothetical protein
MAIITVPEGTQWSTRHKEDAGRLHPESRRAFNASS